MIPAAIFTLLTQTSQAPVEALIYTTLSSTQAHRPEMAMDGDAKTTFVSVGGMDRADDFTVFLSRPVAVSGLRVVSGDESGDDMLNGAALEVSTDGTKFTSAAKFDAKGIAEAKPGDAPIVAFRVKAGGTSVTKLVLREITITSATPISHVMRGPGRPFSDLSQAPDLADWAARATKQMESFWADTEALLYSDGFVPPNKVNIIYRTGPRVTPVAATGGGQMEVNSAYARQHPDDTGLTVHEVAHVIQSHAGEPGWFVEATADYVRWIKFEPQNFTYRIDPTKEDMRQAYRPGAVFLAWCELNYDSRLVSKLHHAGRLHQYSDNLFKKYTGKDLATLGKEFLAAYKADPKHIITPSVPAGMEPRELPAVKEGTSVPVDLSGAFGLIGFADDGAKVSDSGGFDDEGSTYSGTLLGATQTVKGVRFRLGPSGKPNSVASRGQVIAASGQHKSLWLLASGVEGSQNGQEIVVTYTDGTTDKFVQNFSDWFEPESFPGEVRAIRMPYRNLAGGSKDARQFNIYAYGFPLSAKTVKSVTLPNNQYVRVLAVSMAD